MRALSFCKSSWLGLASALLAQPALAQRQPVSPLVPAQVVVAPATAGPLPAHPERPSNKLVDRVTPDAVHAAILVLNSRILVGEQTLQQLNPQAIESVYVYKPGSLPPGWTTSLVTGVLDLKLKKGVRVPSLPLAALKRRLHLKGQVRYEQYGQLLPAAHLRVAKADLPDLSLKAIAPGITVILLSNKKLPPRRDEATPPGRIMLRGVARHR